VESPTLCYGSKFGREQPPFSEAPIRKRFYEMILGFDYILYWEERAQNSLIYGIVRRLIEIFRRPLPFTSLLGNLYDRKDKHLIFSNSKFSDIIY
jgi:hypothetical protein